MVALGVLALKCLVTGGAGFIGSHVTEALLEQGHSVTVLDNFSTGKRDNLAGLGPVEIIEADILDREACARAMKGAQAVIHLAAQVSVAASMEDPAYTHLVNGEGTRRVLEAARLAGIEALAFASSCAVYGDTEELPLTEEAPTHPLSPYAQSKLEGELACAQAREQGMKTKVFRFFNVFGPRQDDASPYSGVIAIFARRLLASRPVTIFGDGEQTRDFLPVKAVAAALVNAVTHPDAFPDSCYNLASGTQTSVRDLYAILSRACGTSTEVSHAPARAGEIRHSLGSAVRFRKRCEAASLPFPLPPLEEALRSTVRWYAS